MAAPKLLPSQAFLQACFIYDPETGILTWRERPREHFSTDSSWRGINRRQAGKKAGCKDKTTKGLVVIVGRVKYLVHRAIWKLVSGEEPPQEIDHRNRNPYDNHWLNLRSATHGQNMQNFGVRKDNELGIKCVRAIRRNGKFAARIMVNGRRICLGHFPSPEQAKAAYDEAAKRLHGEFWSPGS